MPVVSLKIGGICKKDHYRINVFVRLALPWQNRP
jgi:hypothetical protein